MQSVEMIIGRYTKRSGKNWLETRPVTPRMKATSGAAPASTIFIGKTPLVETVNALLARFFRLIVIGIFRVMF
jgi:hypothetical protein